MLGEVDREGAMVLGKVVGHRVEVAAVARPAVDEDQRRAAGRAAGRVPDRRVSRSLDLEVRPGPSGDLERYASDLAKDLSDPDTLALVRATIGTGGEQGAAACLGERLRQLESVLEREQARGNPVPTLERTMDAVLAPLYYRAVFTDLPLTPAWTRSLVTHLLPD
jgi:hypothetical protein